jgi:hypothetical protein
MATPIFHWRHLTLLVLLLVIMIATPLLAPLRNGLLIINLIGAAVLVTGSYAISDRRHFLTLAIILSLASLIGNWFLVMYPGHWVIITAHSSVIALLVFFAITNSQLRSAKWPGYGGQNFRGDLRVSSDRICLGVRLRTAGRIPTRRICGRNRAGEERLHRSRDSNAIF